MRTVCVENYVAISTVEFSNVFFGYLSLCTSIDTPNVTNFTFSVKTELAKLLHGKHSDDQIQTSIFQPSSSKGGTSSSTEVLLLAALTSAPCCFTRLKGSTSTKLKLTQTINTQNLHSLIITLPATFPRPSSGAGVDPDGQESKLDLNEYVS